MPICNIGVGRYDEVADSHSLRSALSEFIATFIFVFAGEGSVLAYASLTSSASLSAAGLTSVALSHAFALFVAVAVAANISGGHVNPAVTFALFLGGHITLLKGILYWIAQLAGAVVACLLLSYITGGATISPPGISVTISRGLVSEIVLTFGLVYTVFTTAVDPRAKGNVALLAPLAIGLVVGANIFFGGAFDGAAMNPARSFGPALVAWDFTNHWIYWVGPLIGGAIATLVYEILLVPRPPPGHQPIPRGDE